jgi:hypothetical protein
MAPRDDLAIRTVINRWGDAVKSTGETDLGELLWNMQPLLHDEPFVFCTLQAGREPPAGTWCTVAEVEEVTCILPETVARTHSLDYQGSWARITLTVHSSLSAVGFLAMISTSLAMKNICVNVVSAYYHDHLFVHWDERLRAMEILQELSGRTKTKAG